MTITSPTKLPSIPDPGLDLPSQYQTLLALKHAVDIIALNASGVPNVTLFALKSDLELLRSQFEAYKQSHP